MKTYVLALGAASMLSLGCAPNNYDIGPENNQAIGDSGTSGDAADAADAADGGLDYKIVAAELYATDPLRHDYDFLRADYGAVLQDGKIYNAGSHIDYSNYVANDFTVAIQGGNDGLIVDLGTDEAVAAALNVNETVASGQGFAALVIHDGHFGLPAADAVLDRAKTDIMGQSHATPANGHVYLLRIVDHFDATFDLVVKLTVVSLTPADRVTFEWMRLR